MHLINGDITLDTNYDSGIPGSPGSRFVLDLNAPPLELNASLDQYERSVMNQSFPTRCDARIVDHQLPKKLCILFVDDDLVLRKLFARSIKRVSEDLDWELREASNGGKRQQRGSQNNSYSAFQ
jgi:hypothetical protein